MRRAGWRSRLDCHGEGRLDRGFCPPPSALALAGLYGRVLVQEKSPGQVPYDLLWINNSTRGLITITQTDVNSTIARDYTTTGVRVQTRTEVVVVVDVAAAEKYTVTSVDRVTQASAVTDGLSQLLVFGGINGTRVAADGELWRLHYRVQVDESARLAAAGAQGSYDAHLHPGESASVWAARRPQQRQPGHASLIAPPIAARALDRRLLDCLALISPRTRARRVPLPAPDQSLGARSHPRRAAACALRPRRHDGRRAWRQRRGAPVHAGLRRAGRARTSGRRVGADAGAHGRRLPPLCYARGALLHERHSG